MPLPSPPYTYDDTRLTYDEVCFFYDGGYDSVCLAGPSAVVVKKGGDTSSARRRRRKEERLPHLNLFIQSSVKQVNEKLFTEEVKIFRFTGEDSPISVFVNGIQLETRYPYEPGTISKIAGEKPDINASIQFLEQINEKTDEEIVASNLQTKLQDVTVEVVEPYSPIKVEITLVEVQKPQEFPDVSIATTLIKKDES